MKSAASFITTAATIVLGAGIALSTVGPAAAQVTVFTDETSFTNATGATVASIPDAASVFDSSMTGFFDCGSDEADALGVGNSSAEIDIDFDTNTLTVIQDPAVTSSARGLCILDAGNTRSTANMDPNEMLANTIVGNGEDDYILSFASPIAAIGFRLITNSSASETFTFYDADDTQIAVVNDSALGTAANTREFVGFLSSTPIAAIKIDTVGGASQNEGIDRIRVADAIAVDINVHPGSDPNPLNLTSGGSTPVAILGTKDFDVTLIDVDTLMLSGSNVKVVGKSDKTLCSVEDIGSFDPGAFDSLGDPDGIDDLVCHFVTSEITPMADGDQTVVKVMGYLMDGTPFAGTDVVKVVKE